MAKLVDISGGDGGVLKETLKESPNGKLCEVGDVVFCHYVGTLEDGSVFDSTRQKRHRQKWGFFFTVGAGE